MKLTSSTLILLLLFSCSNENDENFTIEENSVSKISVKTEDFSFEDYKWLEGKWSDKSENIKQETHEVWITQTDSLVGKGFYVKNTNDTTTPDRTVLKWDNDAYYLINTANNKEVKFKLMSFSKDSLFFKNPAHRYPQEVTYKKVDDNSFRITMNGFVHQANRKINFDMKRYK